MFSPPSINWNLLMPVVFVLGAGVLGVLVEAFVPAKARRITQLLLAMLATLGSTAWSITLLIPALKSGGERAVAGVVLMDPFTIVLQATLTLLAAISLLVVAERTSAREDAFTPQASATPGSDYERQATRAGLSQTEVFPLVLFATGGMMILPAAGDLLTMFVALEVLSLPLYVMTGLARRRRMLSQEAALKYFMLGAFSSAIFLYGIALLYGYAGSDKIAVIAGTITDGNLDMDPLLLTGLVLVIIGLLFKVGAVPFHSWKPDVYQGAPTPITGFMAACTTIAAFGALLRIIYVLVPYLQWDTKPALWTVAILTMLVGTVVGVVQDDLKRMLAYSAIGHAGFMLTGVLAFSRQGLTAVMFYLIVYGVTTVGAFAVISLVRERDAAGNITGEATNRVQWAGLGKRHPLLAGTFALFLLSYAGIPLTSGFVGKFAAFSAAVGAGAWPLAVVGVVGSAIAAFFYARVIVMMFFTDPGDNSAVAVRSSGLAATAIAICAVVTVGLGLVPGPLLDMLHTAAHLIP